MSGAMKFALILLVGAVFLQCTTNPTSADRPVVRELTLAEKQLADSDNKFGLKLFKEIIKQEMGKNVFISPLSVSMALGMVYNGANGETREAMQTTLELQGLSLHEVNQSYRSLLEFLTQLDPKVKLQIANSIWYKNTFTFEKEFIDLNKEYFNALVTGVDFSDPGATATINSWVDENTMGKIKGIVDPPIDPYTVMFLINAVYFKGMWTQQFDDKLTVDDRFLPSDNSKKPCKMMNQKGEFRYFENPAFQAIDLPYGDGDFSMLVFLPRTQTNIDSLISEFSQENWNEWMSSFSKQEGQLQLPRFSLDYGLSLNQVLKALGMGTAFDPLAADFTNLYRGPVNAYISEVMHKSFVDVDEEGTEAAAVTSVTVGVTSVRPTGFRMRVDHPFVFAIRENRSQSILFVGKVVEPGSG